METLQVIVAAIFGGAFVLIITLTLYFNVFDKEEKTGEKDSSSGCVFKLILSVIIVLIVFFALSMCGGDGVPWSPRHT